MRASCILFRDINAVDVSVTDIPAPAADDVLIETLFTGVSPGTELRSLSGRQDGVGTGSFPFIPGYSLVGRVIEPDRDQRLATGTLVFCSGTRHASHRLVWGGHVSLAVVPVDSVVRLPPSLTPAAASLLKLAAIAHRGFRLAPTGTRETVAVVGLGPIGQLSARLFATTGARVVAADVAQDRVALARRAGIEAVWVRGTLAASVRALLPHGADVVVDATGAASILRETADLVQDRPWRDIAAPGGRLVVQGSYSGTVPFPQDVAFTKEMTVLWPRDCQRDDYDQILRLVAAGRLQWDDLLEKPHPAEAAPEVYDRLRRQTTSLLTTAFAWNATER